MMLCQGTTAVNDGLREQLKRAGWRPSARYKGFLETRRAGIEFDLGRARPGDDRLELRYHYVTERTNAQGTVDLPMSVSPEGVGDAMTALYLRVHERPDPTRVFGGGRRARAPLPANPAGSPAKDSAEVAPQKSLDL